MGYFLRTILVVWIDRPLSRIGQSYGVVIVVRSDAVVHWWCSILLESAANISNE